MGLKISKRTKIVYAILGGVFIGFVSLFAWTVKTRKIKFKAEVVPAPFPASINVDATQLTGDLKDEIFGAGLKGTDSVFFRSGYVQTLKKMGVKLLRIHADPYISEGFTKAIGPVESRMEIYPTQSGVNKYPAGPDEWGKAAKEAGFQLSITLPFGDGSAPYKNQFVNLVEYMNGTADENKAQARGWTLNSFDAFDALPQEDRGYFSWLRKHVNEDLNKVPDPGPYNVKYWELGNEVYGSWYSHKVTSSDYISRAFDIAREMKTIDSSIKIGVVLEANWEESVWDDTDDNLDTKEKIWDKEVIDAINKQGKPTLIDFVIPHYYGPYTYTDGQPQYYLYNPKTINYQVTGQSNPPSSVKIAHVRDVEFEPGSYTFSIEAKGRTTDTEFPKLQIRIIDDGGVGNISTDSTVELYPPGTATEIITAKIDADQMHKYDFKTQDGDGEKAVINLTKPTQRYRVELIFPNFNYQSCTCNTIGNSRVGQTLRQTTDFVAQSFISKDKNLQNVKFSLSRLGNASQNAKVIASVYPDNDGQPDEGNLLAKFESKKTIVEFYDSRYEWEFEPIKGQSSEYLTPNTKYWIVLSISENIEGEVIVYGDAGDDYSNGELKVKNSSSGWISDANVKDLYFFIQDYGRRDVQAKNVKAQRVDENNNPIGEAKTIMLSEQEWAEGVILSGFRHRDHINKLKSTIENSSVDILVTEFDFYDNWQYYGAALVPFRQLYPALHNANSLVDFISNNLGGAVVWSVEASNRPYRHQNHDAAFFVNDDGSGDLAQDNTSYYLYTPRFSLFQLLAQNRGNKLVKTQIDSPKYSYNVNFGKKMLPVNYSDSNPSGCEDNLIYKYFWKCSPNLIKPPLYQLDYLNGYTSYDQTNKKLYLTVVNSNTSSDITASISLQGFTPSKTAKVKTLNTKDSRGAYSLNGYTATLTGSMGGGQDRINVAIRNNTPYPEYDVPFESIKNIDPFDEFKPDDLIALQYIAGSIFYSQYFKVSSVDKDSKTLYLKDVGGGPARLSRCFNDSGSNNCLASAKVDVVRLTNNVDIQDSEITNASKSFTYNFPAHSVTVIEFSQLTLKKPSVNIEGLKNIKSTDATIAITGSAEPEAKVSVYIQSETIVLNTQADTNGNWSVTLNQSLSPGEHSLYVTSSIEDVESEMSDIYRFTVLGPDGIGGGESSGFPNTGGAISTGGSGTEKATGKQLGAGGAKSNVSDINEGKAKTGVNHWVYPLVALIVTLALVVLRI